MTERSRTGRLLGAMVVGVLVLSACAKSSGATSGGSTSPPAASGSIATRSIPGVGMVLVNSAGRTLYHLKTESAGSIQCTGGCTGVWPPLLSTGGAPPAAGSGVTGTLATTTRPDGGVQVTYNGEPLYTYSGDSGPGQANGQGIQGVWFAVAASGTGGGASPSTSPSPSGSGYGY